MYRLFLLFFIRIFTACPPVCKIICVIICERGEGRIYRIICQMASQSKLGYVDCLRTFLTLNDIVLNSLTFFERLESFLIDSAEMYEYIITLSIRNKSKTFLIIEPLDSSFAHYWHLQKQNL